jgi:hypothetical protein
MRALAIWFNILFLAECGVALWLHDKFSAPLRIAITLGIGLGAAKLSIASVLWTLRLLERLRAREQPRGSRYAAEGRLRAASDYTSNRR